MANTVKNRLERILPVAVLQPAVSVALSVALISVDRVRFGPDSSTGLEGFKPKDVGMVAIAAGLVLVCLDEQARRRAALVDDGDCEEAVHSQRVLPLLQEEIAAAEPQSSAPHAR